MIKTGDKVAMLLLTLAAAALIHSARRVQPVLKSPRSFPPATESLPASVPLEELFTSGRFGPLYPTTWLMRLWPAGAAVDIVFGLHLAFSAAGMYLVAKRFGVGGLGGVVAAITWSLTNLPLSWGAQPWVYAPIAWLPWAVIFSEFFKLQPQSKTGLAMLLTCALPFYAGDLRAAVVVPVAVLAYLLSFVVSKRGGVPGLILKQELRWNGKKAALVYGGLVVVPLALAAFGFASAPAGPQVMPVVGWLDFFLPGWIHENYLPLISSMSQEQAALSLSIGHGPLLLAGLAFFADKPMKRWAFLLALSGTGSALILGAMHIHAWPLAVLGLFGWSILAAMGADAVFTVSVADRSKVRNPMIVALVIAAAAAGAGWTWWTYNPHAPFAGVNPYAAAGVSIDLLHAAAVWGGIALAIVAFRIGLSTRSPIAGLATLLLTFGALGYEIWTHGRAVLIHSIP